MPSVRLSDIIQPENYSVLGEATNFDSVTKTAFFESAAIGANPFVAQQLARGGTNGHIPMWLDIVDDSATDMPSDDPAVFGTRTGVGSTQMIARRHQRNKAWGSMDLANQLAGTKPLDRISARIGRFWQLRYQAFVLATLRGVIASNVANNGGDMVIDIAIAQAAPSATLPTSINIVDASTMVDAAGSMGDRREDLSVVIMHSTVARNLAKQNIIKTVTMTDGTPHSDLNPSPKSRFYYGTAYVIEDDNVTKEVTLDGGGNAVRYRYFTYFVGTGAIAFDELPLDRTVPFEMFRRPDAGNNSGEDQLYSRKAFSINVHGISTSANPAGGAQFLSDAEIQAAGTYTRVAPQRKQVPLVCLISNG